mmetsp:Transcript_54727/g.86923  ORF Transcript_54727/g.86923 Transcript_54727/m.86923 type:complete len:239 (-) Transcript_54727:534-1250(-)
MLSFNCSHLKFSSGHNKDPNKVMKNPPRMAPRLPSTQGQSDIIVSYVTSPNSFNACNVHASIAIMKPPTAPPPTALPFAVCMVNERKAGPTALPTMQPMDMYTWPKLIPNASKNIAKKLMKTAKTPVKNLDTLSKSSPSSLSISTACRISARGTKPSIAMAERCKLSLESCVEVSCSALTAANSFMIAWTSFVVTVQACISSLNFLPQSALARAFVNAESKRSWLFKRFLFKLGFTYS